MTSIGITSKHPVKTMFQISTGLDMFFKFTNFQGLFDMKMQAQKTYDVGLI